MFEGIRNLWWYEAAHERISSRCKGILASASPSGCQPLLNHDFPKQDNGTHDDYNGPAMPRFNYHPILDGMYCIITVYTQNNQRYDKGTPCDIEGIDLPAGSPPPPFTTATNDDYSPFLDRPDFELADFLFTQHQVPGKGVNRLMEILAAKYGADNVPYASQDDMYDAIDSVKIGDAPWQSFSARYTGEIPEAEPPPWMLMEYDVWYHNPRTDNS